MTEIARQICDIYINNWTKYVCCKDGRVFVSIDSHTRKPRPLKAWMIDDHLKGGANIGIFSAEKSSMFICFDVDIMDETLVRRLIAELNRFGIPKDFINISLSGGKGYHVEVFFDKPVAAATLSELYNLIITRGKFDRHKVEFRPTSRQAVRLPLGVHYKTGNVGWFIDKETFEPIKDQKYILGVQRFSRERLDELMKGIEIPMPAKNFDKEMVRMYIDENHMPKMEVAGTRHDLMLRIAVALRIEGKDPEEIVDALIRWVGEQKKELISSTEDEIRVDAETMAEWVWSNRFTPRENRIKKLVFTAEDINFVLNGRTKLERRILMLIVVLQQIYGKAEIPMIFIAEDLRAARNGVAKAIVRLGDAGVIEHKRGDVHHKDSGWASKPNRYERGETRPLLDINDFTEFEWERPVDWYWFVEFYRLVLWRTLGSAAGKYIGAAEMAEVKSSYWLYEQREGKDE